MSSRTTLKTYFLTGSSPTEAQFADLIDSVLVLDEDLIDNFTSTSTSDALTANAGKILNDSIEALDTRVATLEGESIDYLSNYYTKSEMDASIGAINTSIDGKVSTTSFSALGNTVSTIQTDLSGKASTSHTHVSTDITDLSNLLDVKASITYVDNTKDYLEGLIGAIDPGVDLTHLDDYADLANKVDTIETSLSGYATTVQLSSKAEVDHNHTVSDISDLDLNDYYNKSSVDGLLANVEPKDHTHLEVDITDLDKYTQAQTNLQIQDHSGKTDNPHGVTKAQVGLGNVENLTVAEIFTHPDAPTIPTGVGDLDTALSAHIADVNNPHVVTKSQIGLGDVPNIDVNSLLDSHIAATDPHGIISQVGQNFYTKAETQTKIEENYDAHRYEYKPSDPTDSGGAIGDIAFDNTGVYFKFGGTDWRQVIASKVFNDGSPSSTTEIETPKLEVNDASGNTYFSVDSTTTDTSTTVNTTNLFVTGGSTATNLFEVNGATSVTEINTTNLSIAGTTNIAGSTTIGTASNNQNLTTNGNVTTTGSTSTAGITSTSGGTFTGAGVTIGTDSANQNLTVKGSTSTAGVTSTSGATITGAGVTIGTTSANQNITVNGGISATGTLSAGGATVTSLSAGSGAISTTGTLSTGGATVTSLSAGTGSISTTGTLSAGGISGTSLTSTGLTSTAGITSSAGGTFTGGAVTVGTSTENQELNVNGNATISGNLTISGTTTTIDTTNLLIEDNIVVLNKNQTGTPANTLKSGIEVERGDTANTKIYFDEASDKWKVDVAGTIKTIAFTEDLYSN
jgi:hypothetical protein